MDLVFPSPASLGLFVTAALALLVIPGPAPVSLVGRSLSMVDERVSFGPRHPGRDSGARCRRGAGALGPAGVVGAGLQPRQDGGCRVSDSARAAEAGRSRRNGLCFGEAARGTEARAVDARRVHREPAESEDRDFFLAFLPQFVDVGRGHVASQIAVLGTLLAALGLLTDSAYALAAGSVGAWLKHSRAYASVERYVGGVLLIGLGLTAAFAGNQRK